jgi:hypothetical protein
MIALAASSRHVYSARYRGRQGDFWGTRPPVKLPKTGRDQHHRITDADAGRLDLIAFRYYGDCALWWVIAEANNISNPLRLEMPDVLRIPALETIQMRILR